MLAENLSLIIIGTPSVAKWIMEYLFFDKEFSDSLFKLKFKLKPKLMVISGIFNSILRQG